MTVFAVILALVGIATVGMGVVLFANGTDVNPEGRNEPERIRRGLRELPWRGLVESVPGSVKVLADEEAGRKERLRAAGGFVTLVGVVVLVLALVATIGVFL